MMSSAQGLAVSFAVTADHSPFGEIFAQMTVHVPGHHNALNATAAFAAAVELGFAPPRVTAALARYQGARRRLELKGEADGVRVFDSYAHHPTELAADLRAARDIALTGGSSPSSSRICTAGRGSSPASSARRWAWPTRRSSWTSTPRARIRSPA